MQYLTQWRMQVAARLLSDGAMKVAAVGREVGCASEAAFSRTFKRIAGTSPASWRQATGKSPAPRAAGINRSSSGTA
jgi:AraC-like DNA-binding protein